MFRVVHIFKKELCFSSETEKLGDSVLICPYPDKDKHTNSFLFYVSFLCAPSQLFHLHINWNILFSCMKPTLSLARVN